MPLVPINPNPDFSTNLTGWSGFGASITRIDVSADPPPVGDTWAMRITPDGVTSTPRAFTGLTQITGIVPGENYYARMVAKCNVERDVFFVITWYTAANAVISSSTLFNSFEADTWDYWEGRIVAPANANKAQLVPQMPGVVPGTDLLDVAWCGFGLDFTSSSVTFGTELSGTADGSGPRAAEFDLLSAGTAAGEKHHDITAVPFEEELAGTVAGLKIGVGAGLDLVPSANPHVEENTTGWSPEGGTMDWVATPSGHPFPSSMSLKLTPDGVSTTPHLNGPRLQGIVPGHEYKIRGYAWSPVSQQVRYRLTFYDAATGDGQINIGATDVTINVSSITWTLFEATFVAPSNAVSARVKCRILNTPPTSNYVIFDEAVILPKDARLIQGTIVGGKDMDSGPTSFALDLSGTAQGLAKPDLVTFTDYPPLRARIRVYEPDGALRGQVPLPLSWQAAFPLNDLSSFTMEYLVNAPGNDLLAAPCEVALELSDENNVFQEYPGCRYINIRQQQDLQDPAVTQQLSMPSYGWMLSKVRNINTATLNDEGNRVFTNVTVGSLLLTMLNEAHARGNVPFLVADFTANADSAGVAWPNVLSMSVGVGQDLLSLLRALADQGQCDWRFNGRTLQVYKLDTFLNRNMTTNPTAVVLHPNRDVTTAPDERSYEEIANTILVQGDENKYVTVEQATNPSPWGDWETFMVQGGVKDTVVMQQLAVKALELANAPRTQMTRELMFRSGSPLPHIDYRPGDRILAVDETTVYDTLRVRQITLQMAGEEFSGNVVLGDKFIENDIRVKRRIAALANQAPILGGVGGRMPTTTPPDQTDTRVPNQVTNLALGSATFVDTQGIARGTIAASWSEVTHATDGREVDVQTYRVRYAVQGSTNWRQITVDGGQTSALWGEGINVLTTYTAQVAAVGQNGIQGAWSSAVNVFVQQDLVAPPVPSNPTATTRLGTIRVRWNGRDEDNLPMPVDFKHVEVEMSSTASGPWAPVGIIPTSGLDLIIVDQPYNQARFFRLRSVDTSGNVSDYSGSVSVTTTPLVQTDIIGQILNGANIVPGSINAADKVIANTITGSLIQALTITGDKIAANSITADKIVAGAVTAEKIAAYSIDASRLAIGGNGRNLIADAVASDAELNALRVTQSNGSPNSSSGLVWSDPGSGFFRMKPSTTVASGIARLNLLAYSGTKPNLSSGSVALHPKFCFPYDQDQGSLSASFQVKTSLASGTWPAGMSVGFRMYVRWVLKDGSNSSFSQLVGTITHTGANDWATHTSQNFVIAPVDAVAVIPYFYVTCTNVTTQLQVDVTNFFLAQKNGTVLIENGAITADKIAANTITAAEIAADAITAETLDATAITAKHTITGSVIQTGTSGHRVKMSPNANFLSQAGVTFYSGGSGGRNAYAFIDSGANEGEWGAFNFAIVGPEVTTNSSGRADLSLKIGGGLYLQKQYVNTNHSWSGMVCADTNNELLLGGTFPRGAPLPDTYAMMRFQTWPFQNATINWGIDIGWVFRGSIAPNHAGTTPRYGSVEFSSNTAFGYHCNGSVDTVYTMMWRGGIIG